MRQSQEYAIPFDTHIPGADRAAVRVARLPAGQIDAPAVQRAMDGVSGHSALGERPAPMRAAVVDCEYLPVFIAQEGDLVACDHEDPAA